MKTTSPATISLHQQILGDIERRIVSGEWSPGYQLPIEIEMAKSYQVSRMTMNKVLTRLANNGLIERRKGSGSFVAQPRVQSAVLEIHDIEAEVRSLNREYRFRLVSRTTRKANAADAAAFLPERKSQVLDISCVHFAGRRPFCTEDRLINLNVVPEAGDIDFARHAPGQWLQRQVPWSTAEHKIYAVGADAEHAALLEVDEGAPCLVVQRRTWHEGAAVTFVRFTYPADMHAIIASFTPATSSASTPPPAD